MRAVSQLAGFISPDKKALCEIDYLDQLTDEERHWFYRQIDNDYKAIFYKDGKDLVTDKEEQKRLGREKKHRQIDVYGQMNQIDDYQANPILQVRIPKKDQPKPDPALPVRQYTAEEIEAFKKSYSKK